MSAPTTAVARPGALRRRTGLLALAAALAGGDLAIKAWAERTLPGAPIEGGPLDLQLAFNPGVAFSFAADAPAWTVLTVTALITTAVAVALWRTAPVARRSWGTALAAILGGAAANLIDRAPDGQVTDYLHTGWWPTFNLADVFIVAGGIGIVVLSFLGSEHDRDQRASRD
ncbi:MULTISPECIES: signal peptidase II [Streptomyces]|uniref:signal peptidase II n=1 Tax=Streptomyces TaxID=1883 RepID=UPI002E141DD3|nr:signal peptidase II [Streptomyces phaeochromogenes]WSJ09917.1 signal peptidase II [Streptomyces phaeochromogenes]